MKTLKTISLLFLLGLGVGLIAQIKAPAGIDITGPADMTSATRLRLKQGSSDPATCTASPVEFFWNTTSSTMKYCSATNTWTALGGSSSASKTWMTFGGNGPLSPGGGNYKFFGPAMSNVTGGEAAYYGLVPTDATLTKFGIYTSTSQPGDGSMVCEVRKNESNTGMSVTVASGGGSGYRSTTGSISFVAGDRITVRCDSTATTDSADIRAGIFEFSL